MKRTANLYNDYSRYYLYQYLLYSNSIVDTTSCSSNYEGRQCTFLTEIFKVIWDNANKFQRGFPFWWHLVNFTCPIHNILSHSTVEFFSIWCSKEYGSSKMGTNKTFMLMHGLHGNNKDLLVEVTPLRSIKTFILTQKKCLSVWNPSWWNPWNCAYIHWKRMCLYENYSWFHIERQHLYRNKQTNICVHNFA